MLSILFHYRNPCTPLKWLNKASTAPYYSTSQQNIHRPDCLPTSSNSDSRISQKSVKFSNTKLDFEIASSEKSRMLGWNSYRTVLKNSSLFLALFSSHKYHRAALILTNLIHTSLPLLLATPLYILRFPSSSSRP